MDRATAMIAAAPTAQRIKAEAYALGFDLVGITALGPVETAPAFDAWLERGFGGTMDYLSRGAEPRRDSRRPVAGARSAIVVGMNYGGTEPPGSIARYARGRDYHEVLLEKLQALHRWLEVETGGPVSGKPYVDTGPILERDIARRAGLGWFGKNTMLINPEIGSFFFIGTLLVELDLPADQPFDADRCGTCRRCIDACPTGAIVEPRHLDARRCISYLTIELRESIPQALRPLVGELLFGCDICQDVCPWNVRFSRAASEPDLAPRSNSVNPDPVRLLGLDEEDFRSRFRGSPVKRAKRRGMLRNAAVALGNRGEPAAIPALRRALSDPEPLVRGHAAWALGRIGTPEARAALEDRFDVEIHPEVRAELELALAGRV